jgi:hypothetical protein
MTDEELDEILGTLTPEEEEEEWIKNNPIPTTTDRHPKEMSELWKRIGPTYFD